MDIRLDLTPINFTLKQTRTINSLIIHSMWGTQDGSIAWFKNPNAKASAHYCISSTGEIVQTVLDKDIAYHAGVFDEPIPDYLRPNPNNTSIGIELEDKRDANWPYPQPQRDAFVWLVKHLQEKYLIPRDHILLHKNLNPSRRSDPVGAFSLAWLEGGMADMYKGYDLENKDSMRVAVDILVRVQGGEFIDKPTHEIKLGEAYQKGFTDGESQSGSLPPLDLSNWEENGLSITRTEGSSQIVVNYKKKSL